MNIHFDLISYEYMWTTEREDHRVLAPNGLTGHCEFYQVSTGAGGFSTNPVIMREIIRRMVDAGVPVIKSTDEVPPPSHPLPDPPTVSPEELLRNAPPFDKKRFRAARRGQPD